MVNFADQFASDWTLHLLPGPAHPSYRLITALRLYHLFPASAKEVPPNSESLLVPWKATLLGSAERVSKENEDAWRSTLLRLCDSLTDKARSVIASMNSMAAEDVDRTTWGHWMKNNIKMLWEEELYVASAVSESIRNLEEF